MEHTVDRKRINKKNNNKYVSNLNDISFFIIFVNNVNIKEISDRYKKGLNEICSIDKSNELVKHANSVEYMNIFLIEILYNLFFMNMMLLS